MGSYMQLLIGMPVLFFFVNYQYYYYVLRLPLFQRLVTHMETGGSFLIFLLYVGYL
jgi:hypothetical protein